MVQRNNESRSKIPEMATTTAARKIDVGDRNVIGKGEGSWG